VKHGPFLLITESEAVRARDHDSVVTPRDLSPGIIANVRAVILDDRLEPSFIQTIRNACRHERKPILEWNLSEWQSEDCAPVIEGMLELLDDRNEWGPVHPSPKTVARMGPEMLVDIITTANSLLEPKEVMETVMAYIDTMITCEAWSVLILDKDAEKALSFAVASGPGKDQLANIKVPFGKGIAGWVAKHRQPLIVNNAREDPRFFSDVDADTSFVTRNILCAPLVSRGRTIGVIEMLNKTGDEGFTEEELELVQVLVNPAAVAIENAYLFQRAQILAVQDDLTKLSNSRHLNDRLGIELDRARAADRPVSVIFLDLDGFKSINDNFGHLVGSRALVDIAEIIRRLCEPEDIAGRYGGDEFMLVLPDTDLEATHARAERIRDAIARYRINGLGMTASIGIATFPLHGEDKVQLMRAADKAMYRVKEKGKNGILCAHDL